jgi:3-oxoacyl-[acyl-carrier-protein] synthase-3
VTFSIEKISYRLGENRIDIETFCKDNKRDFKRQIEVSGFRYVHHTQKNLDIFIAEFLSEEVVFNQSDTVIIVNQTNTETFPNLSSLVLAQLENTQRLDVYQISEGCTGFVKALILANKILNNTKERRVHILCSEKYSDFTTMHNPNVYTIFSDAVSITTLRHGCDFELLGYQVINDFRNNNLIRNEIDIINNNKLNFNMNGPGVLDWVTTNSAENIAGAITNSHTNIDEIDTWLVHQASKIVVDTIGEKMKFKDKQNFRSEMMGNTGSSSIPILLRAQLGNNLDKDKNVNHYGLISFGIGLSFTTCILRRSNCS